MPPLSYCGRPINAAQNIFVCRPLQRQVAVQANKLPSKLTSLQSFNHHQHIATMDKTFVDELAAFADVMTKKLPLLQADVLRRAAPQVPKPLRSPSKQEEDKRRRQEWQTAGETRLEESMRYVCMCVLMNRRLQSTQIGWVHLSFARFCWSLI